MNVLKTIHSLLQAGIDFEVRTTVLPGFSDADLLCIAQSLPVLPRYVLNRYRIPENYLPDDHERIQQKACSQEQIIALLPLIRRYQPNATT
jgi:pyruvate formate lyase activating enzyme